MEQDPYIYTDSIEKNILFGLPLEDERFYEALKFSELLTEVRRFP